MRNKSEGSRERRAVPASTAINSFAILRLLRPRQWLKNLMLLFPPLFGGVLFTQTVWPELIIPFVAFCLASSASYAINDVLDADKDACHPLKKNRPVASGAVRPQSAIALGISLFLLAAIMAFWVSLPFFLLLLGYGILSFAYSLKLKNIPVVDIFCVSAGFLLRLQAGAIAFGIQVSDWLFLSVFFLSVFLGLGKRSAEKQGLAADGAEHRPVLAAYPLAFLHGAMYLTGAAVLVTYAMYVVAHPGLLYTVPLCCFGLFRYMYRVIKDAKGDPTEALTGDPFLLGMSCVWLLFVLVVIYG